MEPYVWWTLVALTVAPLWLATYPPMVDLPQHAAQIVALERWLNGNAYARATYEFNWFTPYLGGYMLVYAFSQFVGVLIGLKIVLSAAFVAYGLVGRAVVREVGGNPIWAYVVLPAAYGFSAQWGLLNYIVATPLGIYVALLSLRHVERPRHRGWLVICFWMNMMLLFHALVAVLVGAIGALMTLASGGGLRKNMVRALPFAAGAPLALTWLLVSRRVQSGEFPLMWGWGWVRLPRFVTLLFGEQPSIPFAAAGIMLFAAPLLMGGQPVRQRVRWVPFLCITLIMALAPLQAFGTGLIYPRFAGFLLPFWLLGLTPSSSRSLLRPTLAKALMTSVTAILLTVPIMNAVAFNRETESFGRLMRHMEPDQRALSLVFEPRAPRSAWPIYVHFPNWYAAQGGRRVDFSFAGFFPVVIRFREGQMPSLPPHFEFQPNKFIWSEHDGGDYRYFVVRSDRDVGSSLFRSTSVPVHLVTRQGDWWLYESVAAADHGAADPGSETAR